MYTYEAQNDGTFDILDPDEDVLANVRSLTEAESLISHLNK